MPEAGLHTSGPSTGVPDLDEALDGLYWGDNVVWQSDGDDASPFVDAIVGEASTYDYAAHVRLGSTALWEDSRRSTQTDGGALDRPAPLLDAVRRACRPDRTRLLVFDSLDTMAVRWGVDGARRFFVKLLPDAARGRGDRLLVAVAGRAPRAGAARRRGRDAVHHRGPRGRSIAKAEGRPVGVQGSVYRCLSGRRPPRARAGAGRGTSRDGAPRRPPPAGLSQADLARLAGVSASAISQAERGQRGLSLETLLELTAGLGITVDELLRGEVAPGYRLGRRDDPAAQPTGMPIPLLDDPEAGMRVYLVRLAPGADAAPQVPHKGVEVVAVIGGLVQVMTTAGRPVLRQGEALLADRSGISGWRNIGQRPAALFWVIRD